MLLVMRVQYILVDDLYFHCLFPPKMSKFNFRSDICNSNIMCHGLKIV